MFCFLSKSYAYRNYLSHDYTWIQVFYLEKDLEKETHNSYLKSSFQNDFWNFRITHLPVGNISWWEFPLVSKQGNHKNWSTVVSYLGETCWKTGVSMWFPTDFFAGNLNFPWDSTLENPGNRSAVVSYLRETCGKCEVSMWFPLCLLKETWDFHVVSLMLTWGILRILCSFPNVYFGKPGFPCGFPHVCFPRKPWVFK